MFLGHYAVGFALKRTSPRLSLGILFLAAQTIDLLYCVLSLVGLETAVLKTGATTMANPYILHYPWSHSLVFTTIWSLVGFAIFKKSCSTRDALVVAVAVFSHFALDVVTHTHLPIVYGIDATFGFGVGNHLLLAIAIEIALLLLGAAIYLRLTEANNLRGRIGFIGLISFLLLLFIFAMTSKPVDFSIAGTFINIAIQVIVIAAGFWIDRNRRLVQKG